MRGSLCNGDEKYFNEYDYDEKHCGTVEEIASPRITVEVVYESKRQGQKKDERWSY